MRSELLLLCLDHESKRQIVVGLFRYLSNYTLSKSRLDIGMYTLKGVVGQFTDKLVNSRV